jgi:hypothetical protein
MILPSESGTWIRTALDRLTADETNLRPMDSRLRRAGMTNIEKTIDPWIPAKGMQG